MVKDKKSDPKEKSEKKAMGGKKKQVKELPPRRTLKETMRSAVPVKPANDVESFTGRKRIRRSFGKIREVAEMPNLIEVQRQSYEAFLQAEADATGRRMQGLHEVFTTVFPIKDFADKAEIDYVK